MSTSSPMPCLSVGIMNKSGFCLCFLRHLATQAVYEIFRKFTKQQQLNMYFRMESMFLPVDATD